MTDSPTHATTAPFIARILLSVKDADEPAFFAAVADAKAAGVPAEALLVVLAQALNVHMDHGNPDWPAHLRAGLLDLA